MRTAKQSIQELTNFIPPRQLRFTANLAAHSEEKDYFIAKLDQLATLIAGMPTTGQTEGQGDKTLAYLHYFYGSCDWYITEKDVGDGSDDLRQHQAYGSANLGYGAEFGYISLPEMFTVPGVELDYHFAPRAISNFPKETA